MSIYYSSLCFVAANNPAHAVELLREKWKCSPAYDRCRLFEPGQPHEFKLLSRGDSMVIGDDSTEFIEQLYRWEEFNGVGVIPVSSGDSSSPSFVSDSSRCDETLRMSSDSGATEGGV